MKRLLRILTPPIFLLSTASGQQPETRLNPAIEQVVSAVSADRITSTLGKLESFGTRYVLSPQDDPVHGIGAAKKWIHDQLASYSPRLAVTYQDFTVKKGSRQGQIIRDVELSNVVAVLPGTIDKDRCVMISAHYDTVALVHKPYTGLDQLVAEAVRRGVDEGEERRLLALLPPEKEEGPLDFEATAAQPVSPGVTDDGSGIAAMMELARAMSRYQWDKTVIFVAFAGEEIGLTGAETYAARAKESGMQIEVLLNNDIIGSTVAGNGASVTDVLRLFAAGPDDSPARELARYAQQIAERYVPSMKLEMVFRGDRFLRGGDQKPFADRGYAAVRLTTATENYSHQHTISDTLANTSVAYTTRAAQMNGAVLASLASAPAPPVVNWEWQSGPNKGGHIPMLTRGKSGYDAVLHWLPNAEPDLAGYAVVIRSTTSPVWQRETWVGNATDFRMENVSIDDIVIGLKAVDRDGNQSLVAPYTEPVLPSLITHSAPEKESSK